MKIYSIDHINWLSIEPVEAEGCVFYEFVASINIDHGVFEGKNTDVAFMNFEEFARDYDRFISDRKIEPILKGTYDSYLKFSAGRGNSIFISFSVGDAFCGYSSSVDFALTGKFEVNSEYLNEFYKEFKKISREI